MTISTRESKFNKWNNTARIELAFGQSLFGRQREHLIVFLRPTECPLSFYLVHFMCCVDGFSNLAKTSASGLSPKKAHTNTVTTQGWWQCTTKRKLFVGFLFLLWCLGRNHGVVLANLASVMEAFGKKTKSSCHTSPLSQPMGGLATLGLPGATLSVLHQEPSVPEDCSFKVSCSSLNWDQSFSRWHLQQATTYQIQHNILNHGS